MKVAIHQPNFFPWLGYFDKIQKADCFVFLDHVQLPRTGAGSWVNRVQLAVKGDRFWLTAPIKRSSRGEQVINQVEFVDPEWKRNLIRIVRHAYAKTPFYHDVFPVFCECLEYAGESLSDFNQNAIQVLCQNLGVTQTRFVSSASLGIDSQSTQLLIDITKAVGGTSYLCGGGASDYQEDDLFRQQGIELIYQKFEHPVYDQGCEGFLEGLSVLDHMFWQGFFNKNG